MFLIMDTYSIKIKFLATKLFLITKKRFIPGCDIPVVSYDDLQIDFQHPLCCDLRNNGICRFSVDNSLNPGLQIESQFLNYSLNEFLNLILT